MNALLNFKFFLTLLLLIFMYSKYIFKEKLSCFTSFYHDGGDITLDITFIELKFSSKKWRAGEFDVGQNNIKWGVTIAL